MHAGGSWRSEENTDHDARRTDFYCHRQPCTERRGIYDDFTPLSEGRGTGAADDTTRSPAQQVIAGNLASRCQEATQRIDQPRRLLPEKRRPSGKER